ncbi:hypothetical protein FOE78_12210 [Microlunatus elymi]|uniref:Peptide zinc metalloprotease protein n=1 Tax=Microlunatus elymi TaxID=2596828 RepID=A0A516PZG3_9ACTN|nr:hypothetical protein [Microlunatus elymi]QDP96569.1 hypothetical protein FOE78_12210 [Microlunatus elymi]
MESSNDVDRWRTAPGLELLGPVQDSGLQSATYLVRRSDGQVVQVSALIELVLQELSPDRTLPQVAEAVSRDYDRVLTPDGLLHLLTNALSRLGLVSPAGEVTDVQVTAGPSAAAGPGQAPTTLPRATPILSLSFRGTLVPPSVTRRLASVLRPAYWPPVVWVALVALVGLDVWTLISAGRAGLASALTEVLSTPWLLLALYVTMTLTSLVHELGHATACRYSGGRPGRIGFGIYLVFLAFYTDVTDAYRLSRNGRLRTDLGGLYFNALTVIGMAIAYLVTGHGFFLLVLILLQVEMVQQLLPLVRFDGYYILADLTGVPNLFSRIRPVLMGLRPGRRADRPASDLKPGARRFVTIWVLIVVPVLVFSFGWLLWNLPVIIRTTMQSVGVQLDQFQVGMQRHEISLLILSVVSVLLLMLPLLGIAVLFWRLGRSLVRWALGSSTADQDHSAAQPDQSSVTAAQPDQRSLSLPRGRQDPTNQDRQPTGSVPRHSAGTDSL